MSIKHVLVLGGNGFIGAECVEHLLDTYPDTHQFILLNRGSWSDWDTQTRIRQRIHKSIYWDRKTDSISACLKEYLDIEDFIFEAVIDFSAFKKRDVKRVLDKLDAKRFKVYVLLSSDSVYEVCVKKETDTRFIESDSIRPTSKTEQKRLKKEDSYGHHKLEAELYLQSQAESGKTDASSSGFDYLILRVSDVIGARDSTERFWFYQMWLQYLDSMDRLLEHEIAIPREFWQVETSYTSVKDIGRCVGQLLGSDEIRNQVFNLCCARALSLIDFHTLLARTIRPGFEARLRYRVMSENNELDYHLFPSVTKGPSNPDKLLEMLGFEVSGVEKVFEETLGFYDVAYGRFGAHRMDVEKEVKKVFFSRGKDCRGFDEFIQMKLN